MFKIHIEDIFILVISIPCISYFAFKQYSIMKKSGKTIVKRKNLIFMMLVVIMVALVTGILDYSDNILGVGDMIHIVLMVVCIIQMISTFSNKFYRLCENGVSTGLAVFIKWEDIDGYEWKNDILKIKITKECNIFKLKVKPENIEKVQQIMDKNMVLPII